MVPEAIGVLNWHIIIYALIQLNHSTYGSCRNQPGR